MGLILRVASNSAKELDRLVRSELPAPAVPFVGAQREMLQGKSVWGFLLLTKRKSNNQVAGSESLYAVAAE